MKFLKGILLFLLVVVVVLVIVGFFLPRQMHVEREAVINSSPAEVFQQVAELKNWEDWNPWLEQDPNVVTTYASNTYGEGAWYTWSSENPQVGEGKLTIISMEENKSIQTSLAFGGQDPGSGMWVFEPSGSGTKVTWSMSSDAGMNPISRWFGVFIDGMVGPQFEKGLVNIEEELN